MRKKRLGILVLAVVIALGTGITANSIVSSKISNAKVAVPAVIKPAPTVEILVARHEIQIGKRLKFDDFAWRKWPEELVSPDYFTWEENANIGKKFEGYVARMPMAAGEPIIPGKMIDPKDKGSLSLMLRKGMRAVAVSVAPETGTAGFIMPGDYVDVIVTLGWKMEDGFSENMLKDRVKPQDKVVANETKKTSKSDPSEKFYEKMNSQEDLLVAVDGKTTETVVKNVRVLAIDQAVSAKSTGEANQEEAAARIAATVTLEVTAEQAEVVSLSRDAGTLSLALRSYADNISPGKERVADQIPFVSGGLGVSKKELREKVEETKAGNAIQLLRGSGFNSHVVTVTTKKKPEETQNNDDEKPSVSKEKTL